MVLLICVYSKKRPGDFVAFGIVGAFSYVKLFQRVRIFRRLEQSGDLSGLIYIDLLSSRYFRQSRHGHDLAGQSYDEAGTCGNFQVSYGYFKVCRCAQFCLVIGQAVLCLGYADRAVAEAKSL